MAQAPKRDARERWASPHIYIYAPSPTPPRRESRGLETETSGERAWAQRYGSEGVRSFVATNPLNRIGYSWRTRRELDLRPLERRRRPLGRFVARVRCTTSCCTEGWQALGWRGRLSDRHHIGGQRAVMVQRNAYPAMKGVRARASGDTPSRRETRQEVRPAARVQDEGTRWRGSMSVMWAGSASVNAC